MFITLHNYKTEKEFALNTDYIVYVTPMSGKNGSYIQLPAETYVSVRETIDCILSFIPPGA